jgi:hypothetical protein
MRTKTGKPIRGAALSDLLNNPFYIGIIRLKRTGEAFQGAHEPLIPKTLFDRVQRVLRGKTQGRVNSHEFLFRRLLTCRRCGYSLIGERQKGRAYYRCHTKTCRGTSIREDAVEREFEVTLTRLQFNQEEQRYFATLLPQMSAESARRNDEARQALFLRVTHIADRLNRLTDAYLDGVLDRDAVEARKTALLMERREVDDQLAVLACESESAAERLAGFLELAGTAYSAYKAAGADEQREIVESVTSNREVDGKTVVFTLALPFNLVAERAGNQRGGAHRRTPRTCRRLLDSLMQILRTALLVRPTGLDEPAHAA